MTFDPFGDFDTHGYLRNFANEKDRAIVRRLEHNSFITGVGDAFKDLARVEHLSYGDVLQTHRTLFEAVYPWAGQDRLHTSPDIAVSKGDILFAHPREAQAAVEYGLKLGSDPDSMVRKPGEVMGYLAYGHPFLDGNGRTIMVLHTEMAQRAGISVDWATTNKAEYLTALTRELESPGRGHLDAYLKPYLFPAVSRDDLANHVIQTPGLDGNPVADSNKVFGTFSDPTVESHYQHQQERRQQPEGNEPGLAPDRSRGGRER